MSSAPPMRPGRGWGFVARLGLAQIAIGAVAAIMTSTLNRVMVVELALPATIPSILVALHFVIQMSRARFGFDSDRTGHRAPWILGGVIVFSAGGFLSAVGVSVAATQLAMGLALAFIGYALIGVGMSAAGTALLAHVAEEVEPRRLGGGGRAALDHDDRRDRRDRRGLRSAPRSLLLLAPPHGDRRRLSRGDRARLARGVGVVGDPSASDRHTGSGAERRLRHRAA